MPDSTVKNIYVQPTDCIMKVVKQAIKTSCDIAAKDKPFKKDVIVTPPVQTEDKTKSPALKNN
jgi:hypothetical protein